VCRICVFCTNLSSSPRSQIKEGIGISSFVLQVCFPSTWADSIPLRALWQNVLPKKLLNAAWLSLLSAAWHHTIEEIWHVQVWGQLGEDLAGKRTAPTPVSLLIEEPTKDWLHTVGNILIRWLTQVGHWVSASTKHSFVNTRILSESEVR